MDEQHITHLITKLQVCFPDETISIDTDRVSSKRGVQKTWWLYISTFCNCKEFETFNELERHCNFLVMNHFILTNPDEREDVPYWKTEQVNRLYNLN